jgi:uncharacterized membrane protein YbhN (UPF0104 family)
VTESIAPGLSARRATPRLSLVLGVLASVAVPVGLVLWAGWRDVATAAAAIGVPAIGLALASSLGNYLLRFARWRQFLAALGHAVPWRRNLRIYVAGLALTATPGKVGELVRGLFLKADGVPYGQSFILFFWDRCSDLAGVLLLAVAAGGLVASGYHGLLLGIVVLLGALWLLRPGGPLFARTLYLIEGHTPRHWRAHLRGLRRLRHADARLTPRLALLGITLGAAAYGTHGIGLAILAHAAGAPLDLADAVLVVAVSTLMGAAVLLPGGAGMVEVTSVALLVARGVPEPQAVALGLVHRLTTFWFAIGLGTGCLLTLLPERHHARP